MANANLKLEHSCSMCGEPADVLVTDLCKPCYSYKYYWKLRTLKEKLLRLANIKKYEHRMEVMTATSGKHLKLASSSKK